MPVQSNLTLNSLSYLPRGKNNNIAKWALVGDTSFGGASSYVTESVADPSKDGVTRIRFRIQVPKAAAEDSACACTGSILGTGLVDCSILVPANFTSAERTDFAARVQDLFASSVFQTAIANLEGSW